MATKKTKDFTKLNTTKKVFDVLEQATQEEQLPGQMEIDTAGNVTESKAAAGKEKKEPAKRGRKNYTDLEKLEAMEAGETSGKAGMKMLRINMAFTPSNYSYIRVMSKALGMNMTDFVNLAIERSMEDHSEMYEEIKTFKAKF